MGALLDNLLKQFENDVPKIAVGEEAIKLSGLQQGLADILAEQTKLFGSMTTLRVGNPNNILPYDRPCAPKPITVHSKTSPMVGGFIPADPLLNKLNDEGVPIPHHHHDNLDTQPQVQLKSTLYELLSRCNETGNLEVDVTNDAKIQFKIKQNKAPTNHDIIFTIDLTDKNATINNRTFTRPQNTPLQIPTELSKLSQEILYNKEFPILYSTPQKNQTPTEFKPLMVFADKQGLPIAGDWDKDLESLPLINAITDNPLYNQEINTLIKGSNPDISNQSLLLKRTKELFFNLKSYFSPLNKQSQEIQGFFGQNEEDFERLLNTPLLERAGVITPYEFFQNMFANYCWNKVHPNEYLPDPFQHGAENRSPFKGDPKIRPDPGGPRLHVYDEKFIYTEDEDQRVVLYKEILENNFFHIHPSANMEKWHEVIEKQVELGQANLISPQTINSYLLYKVNNNSINGIKNSEQWNNIIQRQIDFAEGPYILDQNPESPQKYSIPKEILAKVDKNKDTLPLDSNLFIKNKPVLPKITTQNFSKQLQAIEQATPYTKLLPTKKRLERIKTKQTDTAPNSPLNQNKDPVIFRRARTLPPIEHNNQKIYKPPTK